MEQLPGRHSCLLLVSCLCLLLAIAPVPAWAQGSASELMQGAQARVEAYRDYFARTLDMRSRAGELQQALSELDQACPALMTAGDRAGAATCLVKSGDVVRMLSTLRLGMQMSAEDQRWIQNMLSEANRRYREGERLARAERAVQPLAEALIGQVRTQLGAGALHDYRSAASATDEAIRVAAALPDRRTLARGIELKSQLDVEQGDLVAGADGIDRALAIYAKLGDDRARYYVLLDRGSIFERLAARCDFKLTFVECDQDAMRARADYEAARSIGTALGWSGLIRQIDEFISSIELRRRLIANRKRMHASVAGWFHPSKPGDALVTERYVTSGGGVPRELVEAIATGGGLPGGTDARGAYVQGIEADMRGDGDAALASYLRAVALLEGDRQRASDSEARGVFLEDKIDFYYPPVLHLLQRGKQAEAFRLMEASRSRVLSDLLATRSGATDHRQRALVARHQELRAKIGQLQKELFALRTSPDYDAAGVGVAEQDLERLERERASAAQEMQRLAPGLLEPAFSEPVPLGEVLQGATAGRYDVLEYLVLETGVIVWHIGSGGVHVRNVFLPRAELGAKVAALRKNLVDPRVIKPSPPFDPQTAREMFLFLVEPMLQWVKSGTLVVIPHEDLHYVPFQVFQDPSDGRFLGEKFRISYAPSATVLSRLKPGGGLAGSSMLAVAGPRLPAGVDEVKAISRLYPAGRVTLLLDEAATEEEVTRRVASHGVLHLAAHGVFDGPEPLLSYIELRRSSGADGRLTAAEMYGLPLGQARLVTLSACETGRAEATHAGEVIGMQRALIYAGAGALLLTQWKVDSDSTKLWMETFYREAGQVALPEAARRASAAVLAKPEYAHPYFWGAFFLVGR
jgi:CHAT domain-containing protein